MQKQTSKKIVELDRTYSVLEVAELLGCSSGNVIYHIKQGDISARKLGKHSYMIYGREIQNYMLAQLPQFEYV